MPARPLVYSAAEQVRDLFNDRAPTWGGKYVPRGKLIWRLDEFCDALNAIVPPPGDVLDFGCGTGHLANFLREHHYTLTACDIADRMVEMARSRFERIGISWVNLSANWRRLPFADSAFDAVVASSVLEYVDDLDSVFSELGRVLRPGGLLIFNVPNPNSAQRKREYWTDRLTRNRRTRQAVTSIPRIRRLLHYLQLSKNRHSLVEWERRVGQHGFHRLQMASRGPANPPLFLFGFRKAGDAAGG